MTSVKWARRSAVAAWICALLLPVMGCAAATHAEGVEFRKIADGVWFVPGNGGKGYCNNVIIEMQQYLIVVDANYPGRAQELVEQIHRISPKPVLFVFDTHAHRDHSYGNIIWTRAGAVTFAYQGVVDEMNRYEPERWQATAAMREDVRALHLTDAPRPELSFSSSRFVLQDATREVDFYFLGWAHTRGDGFVWLPKERILCTGDAAINGRSVVAGREGPRNKLWDANLGNWPAVMEKAEALHPLHVLPGHGEPGGVEILEGQQHFIQDLLEAVQRQVAAGKTPAQMTLSLPARDRDWTPADLSTDFSIAYSEITEHKPAGDVPHVWK
ncbi:MAG TPA: MBL fold metallo-hydrolase [Acidobacteriaceae bacterium]|nr:MBL fold metallo-hydrolase [Acidobacteriaceae bacterium]